VHSASWVSGKAVSAVAMSEAEWVREAKERSVGEEEGEGNVEEGAEDAGEDGDEDGEDVQDEEDEGGEWCREVRVACGGGGIACTREPEEEDASSSW
jgi:hypothetical protein